MSVSFYVGNLRGGATTIDFVEDLDINMSKGKARMVLNAGHPGHRRSMRPHGSCSVRQPVRFVAAAAHWQAVGED